MNVIKKIICICFIFIFITNLHSAPTSAATFSDLNSSHWAYNYIMDMVNAGILSGYEDGTFRPDAYVTRGEMWKISVLALSTKKYITIPENTGGHWAEPYGKAIKNYNKSNYAAWYLGDTFKSPDEIVNRNEISMLITSLHFGLPYSAFGSDYSNLSIYKDCDVIKSSAFGAYIKYVTDLGFMSGYDDGYFHPDWNLTRAEICTVLHKVFFAPNSTGGYYSDINNNYTANNTNNNPTYGNSSSQIQEDKSEVYVNMDINSSVSKNIKKLKTAIMLNGQKISGGYGFKQTSKGATVGLLYTYEQDVCTFLTEIPTDSGTFVISLFLYENVLPTVIVTFDNDVIFTGYYSQPDGTLNITETVSNDIEDSMLKTLNSNYDTFDAFLGLIGISHPDFKEFTMADFGIGK